MNQTSHHPLSGIPGAGAFLLAVGLALSLSCGGSRNSVPANHPPIAKAGADITTPVGQTVTLSGTASSDPDGDKLSYQWHILQAPAGSKATILGATAITATFVPDVAGAYTARLTVSDGRGGTAGDNLVITATALNHPPVAQAGQDVTTTTGQTVTLSGASSSDPDGDSLSYQWLIVHAPTGTTAGLQGATFAQPVQAPAVTGQPFPGQAYPGQPYPGQPFPGQPVQGQYGAAQQPIYPPSPQYGGQLAPNGAPAASPVPPPAAYAPTAPPPQGPGAPSEPGLPTSADSADSDGTVFSTGIAMTHKPTAPRQGADNLVLAVVCSFGHPNPPGSPRCRMCGQPVDNANPRLVHKPVLAQLITAGGARVEVTDTVLIGRAPSAQAGDGNPILLPVPSPNSDISRTHLKVSVKDWDIVATDLHSTNGTMLVRPGQAPVRMMPGTPVTVEPGTILDLGDGGVITVGTPA